MKAEQSTPSAYQNDQTVVFDVLMEIVSKQSCWDLNSFWDPGNDFHLRDRTNEIAPHPE